MRTNMQSTTLAPEWMHRSSRVLYYIIRLRLRRHVLSDQRHQCQRWEAQFSQPFASASGSGLRRFRPVQKRISCLRKTSSRSVVMTCKDVTSIRRVYESVRLRWSDKPTLSATPHVDPFYPSTEIHPLTHPPTHNRRLWYHCSSEFVINRSERFIIKRQMPFALSKNRRLITTVSWLLLSASHLTEL